MLATTRTTTLLTVTLTATAVAAAAAFAVSPHAPGTVMGAGHVSHTSPMEPATVAAMERMMADGATVGQMHAWMRSEGIPVGHVHHDVAAHGTTPGQMHHHVAPPASR